jgi:SAM-dependent MidA family methyltransferase
VELGPGRGTLLADAGRIWRRISPDFADTVRLHLVEMSPALRACQRTALAAWSPMWHARLAEVPKGPMILLANEFFDALSIHQYVRRDGVWRERLVGLTPTGDGFVFIDGSVVELPDAQSEPGALDGAILELCPDAEMLAAEIGARVMAQGGVALIIDYGSRHSALGDTLQAVRHHRYADPLEEPGEADLSHHVDFERLRRAAEHAGAITFGPISQGLFFARLGIAARAEALARAADSPELAEAVRDGVRRLIHPGRMGSLFKAFAIADPGLPMPPGFAADTA